MAAEHADKAIRSLTEHGEKPAVIGEVRRGDFGIDFNMPLGVDKLALGDKVKVELDIQFVAPTPDGGPADQA